MKHSMARDSKIFHTTKLETSTETDSITYEKFLTKIHRSTEQGGIQLGQVFFKDTNFKSSEFVCFRPSRGKQQYRRPDRGADLEG